MSGIELLGGEELEARFLAMADAARGPAMSRAIAPAAELVLASAHDLVPKPPGAHLDGSLFAEETLQGPDGAEWGVGTRADKYGFVAPFVEYGTSPHEQHHGHSVHPGGAAHPFLRPALDQNQDKVIDLIGEGLRAEVEKAGV